MVIWTKRIMDAASFPCKHELETLSVVALPWHALDNPWGYLSHLLCIREKLLTTTKFKFHCTGGPIKFIYTRGKHSICFTKCEAFFSASSVAFTNTIILPVEDEQEQNNPWEVFKISLKYYNDFPVLILITWPRKTSASVCIESGGNGFWGCQVPVSPSSH